MARRSDVSVVDKIRQLGVDFHPGDNGPYSERAIVTAETKVGRKFASAHRTILAEIGGNFGFEDGAVEVSGTELNLKKFFGVGSDDFDIAGWWGDYAGQIPEGWYPFAQDHDGDLYLVGGNDAIHHVVLDERLWACEARPKTAGKEVAPSFESFVDLLEAPDFDSA